MQNKSKLNMFLLVIIILLVAVSGYLFINNYKHNENKVLNNKEDEIIKKQNLISDVYPLYPELSWNNEEPSTISDYNNLPISGFRVSSKNISDSQYYKFGISFEKYYDDKLSSLGWIRDSKYQADGAGSSIWAYTKDNNIISLSYHSISLIDQKPDQPFSCPCEMTFSIFSGTKDNNKEAIEYNNTELGFSFISLYGKVKSNTYDTPEGLKETPFITKGDKGESFRGYISFQNPIFHFSGMTPDYELGRGAGCAEVRNLEGYEYAVSQYGEIKNAEGFSYVYGYVTNDEMTGPHQIALFKLNKGQFPVLGFCAIGESEANFKKIIDTVKIGK